MDLRETVERDAKFVDETGAAEDRAVICAIQRGLPSGANKVFTYGLFESAIVHFHRSLDALLAEAQAAAVTSKSVHTPLASSH